MDLGQAWRAGLGLVKHEADEEETWVRTAGVKGCGSSERGERNWVEFVNALSETLAASPMCPVGSTYHKFQR